MFFSHSRSYGYQMFGANLGPNGYNWFVNQQPYVTTLGPWVAVVFGPELTYWFNVSGGTYSSLYPWLGVELTADTGSGTLTLTRSLAGRLEIVVFNDLSAASAPGGMVSATDGNGVKVTVASRTGSQINELQRTYTIGGTTMVDSLLYAYFSSGSASGLMQSVTYRRQVSGGSWTPIQQTSFAYYGASDVNGSVNDLQSATQEIPDGTGGWDIVGTRYYRYWLAGASTGFGHALKAQFGPEACRLMFNAGINPATASDAVMLPYADHYFEYNPSSQRVTKEISAVCESCTGGGASTDLFSYAFNPRWLSPGYGTWQTKTTQTLPDGSAIVAYTNFAGLPILYVNVDSTGANMWGTFYRYNSDGQVIWEAHPSAVALPSSLSTLEAYDDLLNYNVSTSLYQYLNNSSGLIDVTDYYSSSGSGGAQYDVRNRKVRQGQSGSDVLVESFTYGSNTDSNGNIVYPVAMHVSYPDASDPTITITTSYSYTYASGTDYLQQRTTTLPAISLGQNGSGTAATIVEEYDSYGNLMQRTDERGIVNTYAYGGLGLVSEQILNYQSGVTPPGVNVTTDFVYDMQGRLTQTTGPAHTVVLSGTATSVQSVTWNVYVQSVQPTSGTWDVDQTWTGKGYAVSGPTFTLIDPVTIVRNDKDGRATDKITSHRTTGSGALSPTDTFAQTDWQSWSSTQYDNQHRTLSDRTYFLIPSSGEGVAGTNYGQTTYGYDALERRNRVVSPGGTITRTVWTCPQRVASLWVGTDDTDATDSNPAPRATYIQGGTNSASGSAVSVTLGAVTAGDTLVAYGALQSTAAPSSSAISDNQGNTWTLVQSQAGASASAGGAGLWAAHNVAAGSTTITFNAGSGPCGLIVAEYSNLSDVSGISDGTSSASTTTASTTPTAGNFTTTYPINQIFGAASQAATNVTWTAGSGFTLRGNIGSATNMAMAIEDQLVFSTGTYNPSMTMSASAVWTAIGAALVSANNMVLVTENQYDGGAGGGDGNLTQQTQYTSSTGTRVTSYGYDFRDRQTSITDALGGYTVYTFDNLDRQTQTRRYASSGGNLIAQGAANFDDRNRVYQQIVYSVDPSTGTVGNSLVGNSWYDPSGNLLQKVNPGDGQVFSKSTYNGVNWVTAAYTGYNPSGTSYSQATTVTNDIILEQTQNTFDEVGNLVSVASFQRLNDAPSSGTGSTGALSYGTQPKGRVSYAANWFDSVDRNIASANYGAIASFTRPSTPPASSSTVLVTSTSYNEAGQPSQTTDPVGYVIQTTYDNAGRTTQTVEDYGSGLLNRTTNWTYTLDNLVATLVAVNSTTGNQTTTYTYGTNLMTSGVARNDLLASVTYPDSVSGSDVVSYTYNTLGQHVTITDQRGTVRTFYYDKLGRQTDDAVSTVGSSTDNAVLRISTTYEVRGMVATVSSYDNATPGSGTALNQCALTYNSFSQLTKEQQDHSGTVSGSSPSVQYIYDTGASSSNETRLSGLIYPNGRVITYSYGTSGGMNDLLNRVDTIQDTTSGTTNLASYTYLGLGMVVRITYPQPSVWLDLWGGTSGTFDGLDLFNRITDQRWQNGIGGTPADIDRHQYGYDQNSNRLYKANTVGTPIVSGGLDEYYTYDHLNRLSDMQRGTLNSGKTGISGTPSVEQTWSLDPTGNWSGYVTKAAGTTNLNQTRTSNTVNEITNLAETTGPSWVVPVYDAAGNMTTIPQTVDPTQSYTATYDAWNRMIAVSTAGSLLAQYFYDGKDRRVVKLTYSSGTLSETRHLYYATEWQDIEERVGTSTTMDQQYLWGMTYADALICRDRPDSERFYSLHNAGFDVTALCDGSGAIQERYIFDPYGTRSILSPSWSDLTSSAHDWFVGPQGLTYDDTGLLYNRERMRHSQLGRFVTRDPLNYYYESTLYGFPFSNPLVVCDPSGLGPDVGGWSGINSTGGNFGGNYVEQWLDNSKLPFDPNLGGQSKLNTCTVLPCPRQALNNEAQSFTGSLGNYCDSPGNPHNISILMIEPATSRSPSASDRCCCNISIQLLYNPYDIALELGGIPNDPSDRQKQVNGWGQATPIEIPNFIGHNPGTLQAPFPVLQPVTQTTRNQKGRPVTTTTFPRTGGSFDPRQWINKARQNSDATFVCHSQGCNLLLSALDKACSVQLAGG